MKERTISGSRGCIYDRNGNLLAYNELAHSVTIEDVYENSKMKNYNLNSTIATLIQMLEKMVTRLYGILRLIWMIMADMHLQ